MGLREETRIQLNVSHSVWTEHGATRKLTDVHFTHFSNLIAPFVVLPLSVSPLKWLKVRFGSGRVVLTTQFCWLQKISCVFQCWHPRRGEWLCVDSAPLKTTEALCSGRPVCVCSHTHTHTLLPSGRARGFSRTLAHRLRGSARKQWLCFLSCPKEYHEVYLCTVAPLKIRRTPNNNQGT